MKHEVVQLSRGWSGTNQTVEKIRQMVDESLTDPVVVLTAQNLIRHLPERDTDGEIQAVSNFVRRNIRYTHESIETLKSPRVLIDEIKRYGKAVGDCDDHVILWAALHKSLGNRVRFKVISQRRDKLANHIFAEVYSPKRGWITDDTIVKNQPLGWKVPGKQITLEKTYLAGLGDTRMSKRRHSTGNDFASPTFIQPAGERLSRGDAWLPSKKVFSFAQETVPGFWDMKDQRSGFATESMYGGAPEMELGALDIMAMFEAAAPKLLERAADTGAAAIKARIDKLRQPKPIPASVPPSTLSVERPSGGGIPTTYLIVGGVGLLALFFLMRK